MVDTRVHAELWYFTKNKKTVPKVLFNTFDTALCEMFSDAYMSNGYLSSSGLSN